MTYTHQIALGIAAAVAALTLAACGASATHNTSPTTQAPAATGLTTHQIAYGTRTQFVTIAQGVNSTLKTLTDQPLATQMTDTAKALQTGEAKFKAITWPPAAQFMVTVVENDMAAGATAALNFDIGQAAAISQRLPGDLQAVARNAGWAPFAFTTS